MGRRDRRGPGADVLLGRALAASAAAAGARLEIGDSAAEPWHSATFSGARHAIRAEAYAGPAVARWLDELGPEAVHVPGHLVADVAFSCADAGAERLSLRFDALTVAGV